MSKDNRRKGIVFGLVASAIWGGMYVVSKVVLDVIPPFTLLSLRLLLGIAALGAWMAFERGLPRLGRQLWLRLIAIGLLGYGISLGFQLSGTKLSTAANGAVITAATPAFVYLFAWLVLKERVTTMRLGALLVSTLGVLLVIDPRQAELNAALWLGNLLLVGAAITWALYSVLVRHASQHANALSITLVAFVGGMLLAFPAGAWELSTQSVGAFSPAVTLGVLYLGLVSTALAAYLWNKAFELLDAGVASLTFFAQPIVGVGLGALFLNEELSYLFLAGSILILIGLWLAARDDRIHYSLRK